MADGVDAKGIGYGAKDIVMGVLGAVAGGYGGAAGANAVDKADKGIDKLVSAAGGGEPPKSRADRMDQADKPPGRKNTPPGPPPASAAEVESSKRMAAGPPPASAAEIASAKRKAAGPPPASAAEIASAKQKAAGPPPASAAEVASSQGKPGEVDWPPEGDARVTADHLAKLGYSREQTRTILAGGEGNTLAQVTREGAPRSVEGTRIAPVPAQPIRMAQASSVPIAASQPTVLVRGTRVADGERVPSVDGNAVPIVAGRRIDNKGGPQTA